MLVSLVIPVYNEVESLRELHQAIHRALDGQPYLWEVIFVDDGSSDGSVQALEALAAEDPEHTAMVELRRNYGQTTAIAAGIDHAEGEVVVLLDADLQNDPSDIPMMLARIEQGSDVVSGWRVHRHDKFFTRRLPSRSANWLISWVTGVHLHDYGCTLKAYRREVITGFRLYGEMHRFIPAYASQVGAKIVEVPVQHHPRRHGQTKYGLTRTLKVVLDLFTVKYLLSFADKPIYLFGGLGVALIAISLVTLFVLVVRRITLDEHLIRSPLLLLTTMLFILGTQSILLGLLAELLARTYHESQAKPTYTIRQVLKRTALESQEHLVEDGVV